MYHPDYRELAESLHESLSADPFYVALLEPLQDSTANKKEAFLKYLEYSILEAQKYGRLFIPSEQNYGVSIWSKPQNPSEEIKRKEEKKYFIKQHLGEEVFNVYSHITSFMADRLQGAIPDDAWYLSILGVRPAYQGKGMGSALVREVLKDTDNLKKLTYLETFNPKSIPFYQRLGYEIFEENMEPITNAPYWILIRQPLV